MRDLLVEGIFQRKATNVVPMNFVNLRLNAESQ